jgi:putative ABC transport system ATP-binding protein
MSDEPTGNLDTKSGQEILAILQDLNEKGITLVMVAHEREVA